MSSLGTNDKQILEKLLQMGGGYVLNFSDRTFGEFFRDDVSVNIYHEQYNYASGSKANRLRGFWQVADDPLTGESIEKLIAYIETQILLGALKRQDFPSELIRRSHQIAVRLQGTKGTEIQVTLPVALKQDFLSIYLRLALFDNQQQQRFLSSYGRRISGNIAASVFKGILLRCR